MNPLTGLDIIRTNLILKTSIEDGVVRVVVDLPADHQFASAIKEDISEKLRSLWDVKRINVVFIA
jgi:phage tail sheath protein FI